MYNIIYYYYHYIIVIQENRQDWKYCFIQVTLQNSQDI